VLPPNAPMTKGDFAPPLEPLDQGGETLGAPPCTPTDQTFAGWMRAGESSALTHNPITRRLTHFHS
jgi:hypothetical protein